MTSSPVNHSPSTPAERTSTRCANSTSMVKGVLAQRESTFLVNTVFPALRLLPSTSISKRIKLFYLGSLNPRPSWTLIKMSLSTTSNVRKTFNEFNHPFLSPLMTMLKERV